MGYHHPTAMLEEAVECLNLGQGKLCVDGTLGGSGHARLICNRIFPGGRFIGIDQDEAAIANAASVLEPFGDHVHLFQDNFENLPAILSKLGIEAVDGVLLDLGISLYHLRQSGRGFSFNEDEPLDMRMDTRCSRTASDLVNSLSAGQLEHIFRTFGEERYARRIAGRIVLERDREEIRSSKALAELVLRAVPSRTASRQRIHPATRVFMALRIAVNRELEVLEGFLRNVIQHLNPGGRLCILSFHSLEDRMVKQHMNKWQKGCSCPPGLPVCACGKTSLVRKVTNKPLRPPESEVDANPMARSTRLRAVEKI
jgi:16S rRNA (cytosine1402-N4)-methyltransferase